MMIEAVNMLAAVYSKQQSEAGIFEVEDVRA
jgi:hypothetical protein